MSLELFFVVLQSISVVSLGAVGVLDATKRRDSGLNRIGKGLLLFAVLAYLCSTSALCLLASATQTKMMKRIEDLHVRLLDEVMEAPPEITPSAPSGKLTTELQISKPGSGSVNWRPIVEGRVADPKADVWVIVHPLGLSSYWVEPPVTVLKDGTWQVQVYIGRAGDIDKDKEFEIMAIANPTQSLAEGQVLSEWPSAKWRSDVVRVVRK